MTGIDREVIRLNDTIDKLSQTILDLKKEYAQLIYNTYKNRNAYDRLMFIFSSRDFNQAYRRLEYKLHTVNRLKLKRSVRKNDPETVS